MVPKELHGSPAITLHGAIADHNPKKNPNSYVRIKAPKTTGLSHRLRLSHLKTLSAQLSFLVATMGPPRGRSGGFGGRSAGFRGRGDGGGRGRGGRGGGRFGDRGSAMKVRGGGRGGRGFVGGGGRGRGGGGGGRGGGMKGGSKVVIEPHRHEGVFLSKGRDDFILTKNLVPGEAIYLQRETDLCPGLYDFKMLCGFIFVKLWKQVYRNPTVCLGLAYKLKTMSFAEKF